MGKFEQVKLVKGAGICAYGRSWVFDREHSACLLLDGGERIDFDGAGSVERSMVSTGLGDEYRVRYSGFKGCESLSFETIMRVNDTTGHVDCTFVPLDMGGLHIKEVCWPQPLVADDAGAYAVLNTMQGQLLPNDWPEAVGEKMPFGGQMGSESAYMPWWGEIAPDGGYLCYVRTFWDSAYTIEHPAGGPTRVFVRHLPSQGEVRYARTVTYCFVPAGSDYVTLCKLYRGIAEEEGRARTLRSKAAQNPNVQKLIGCCVMHVEGKTHLVPDCAFYDHEHPENNDKLVPFAHWEERVRSLHDMGVD